MIFLLNLILNIASSINFNNSITLFGQEATREKLLEILAKSDTPLFAMSHGNPDILYAQNGEIALASSDENLLGKRSVYGFACYTAIRLGESVAQQGGIWWGYSDRVACYIDNPKFIQFFQQIFQLIYHNFAQAKTVIIELLCMCLAWFSPFTLPCEVVFILAQVCTDVIYYVPT